MANELSIKRPPIRTFVVPAFIYKAAMRANLHLMDLTVYTKLRSIASIEDIATYAALHNTVTVAGKRLSELNLNYMLETMGAPEKEVDYTLNRMTSSTEIKDIVVNRLESLPEEYQSIFSLRKSKATAVVVRDGSIKNTLGQGGEAVSDLPYQLKTSGSTVFIVLDHGFSKYVEANHRSDDVKLFVRDFIQLCDGLFSHAEVAQHPLFETFLNF